MFEYIRDKIFCCKHGIRTASYDDVDQAYKGGKMVNLIEFFRRIIIGEIDAFLIVYDV